MTVMTSWMKQHTHRTPTDDPELIEQFDGNLEDADASASQVFASASRSFQEARELLSHVKRARGYVPVVGNFAKVSWQTQEGQEEREIVEGWKTGKPGYTSHFAKTTHLTFRVSSSDVQEASD